MTDREKAIVMAYTGVVMLTGDRLSEFYKYVQEKMNRPVYTHELYGLMDVIKHAAYNDFVALCEADEAAEGGMTMPRLIDADALCRKQEEMYIHTKSGKIIPTMAVPVWAINNAPVIDAEPVRHGRWIRMDDTFARWQCSECGTIESCSGWEYCHCGAKMDGKDIDVPTKPETHRPEDCVNYATRQRDGRAVCLGTRELDLCDGARCKRWKGKVKDE